MAKKFAIGSVVMVKTNVVTLHSLRQQINAKVYSNVYNGKSKHIGLRPTYVHQLIKAGVIIINYVQTSENLTDLLTKGLARDLVLKTSKRMGLKPTFLITNNEAST